MASNLWLNLYTSFFNIKPTYFNIVAFYYLSYYSAMVTGQFVAGQFGVGQLVQACTVRVQTGSSLAYLCCYKLDDC